MLRVNATAFLFILEFLLVLAGISVLLFLRYRRQKEKEVVYRHEIQELQHSAREQEKQNEELLGFKEAFGNMQRKLDKVRAINLKLKQAIDTLVPEAERTEEYKKLIAEIEQNNKELDLCINTLERENEELAADVTSFRDEVDSLSRKLKDSVSRAEFDKVEAENKRLELRVESLQARLAEKTAEYEKLEKNYMWLEKEYNALYNNIHEEASASAGEQPS